MTNPNNQQTNAATGHIYSGEVGALLETVVNQKGYTSNHWATMDQWNKKGRSIAKGQTGTIFSFTRKAENDDGEIVETTTTVYVFNRCQLQKLD